MIEAGEWRLTDVERSIVVKALRDRAHYVVVPSVGRRSAGADSAGSSPGAGVAPMRQRGRKSAESLLVVPSAFPQRPDPPKELSPDQAELWRGYVGDMPADWFTPKTWPDLANLCGLVTECALLRSALHDYAGGLPADAEGYMRHRQIRKDYESLVLARLWKRSCG